MSSILSFQNCFSYEELLICTFSTLSTTITDSTFKIAPECYTGNNLIILKRNYAEQATFYCFFFFLLAIRMVVNKGCRGTFSSAIF